MPVRCHAGVCRISMQKLCPPGSSLTLGCLIAPPENGRPRKHTAERASAPPPARSAPTPGRAVHTRMGGVKPTTVQNPVAARPVSTSVKADLIPGQLMPSIRRPAAAKPTPAASRSSAVLTY
jgi:hypothetical protein